VTTGITTVVDPDRMVTQLSALAQVSRLAVMRLLARYQPFGLPAGDIARLTAVPHNTMSTHLALLEAAGLVRSRREGRSIFYAADAVACLALAGVLQANLARPRSAAYPEVDMPMAFAPKPIGDPTTVLVLCTANSARSIIAEAMINREGKGLFRAFSAGSNPRTEVNRAALKLLADVGYQTTGLHAKHRDVFAAADAPRLDLVITVCDAAAGEPCPSWPGHPLTAHWGIPDPVIPGASETEQRAAMITAFRQLASRVSSLVTLPVASLSLATLKSELAAIGKLEGATPLALAAAA
jgi:ArsR family transcriptional regulator, arsenate/arsenite/antimonite-responsive transcriptional repressor / arsenate reductase (thioredoxin)